MLRPVIVLCLFLALAGAGLSNGQWSYEDYLKELAELKKRFQLAENVTTEGTVINSVNNNESSTKNDNEKPKELSVSEPLLMDFGNKLEEDLGSEVSPTPKGISAQNETLQNDQNNTEILPDIKSILTNASVQQANLSVIKEDQGSQPEEKPLASPPSEEKTTQPSPATEVLTTEKETLTTEANSSVPSTGKDDKTPKLHSHLPVVGQLIKTLFRDREDKLEEHTDSMNCSHDHVHVRNETADSREETHTDLNCGDDRTENQVLDKHEETFQDPNCADEQDHTEKQVLEKNEQTHQASLEKDLPKEVPKPEPQEGDKNNSQLTEEFHHKPEDHTAVPVQQTDIGANVTVKMDAASPKDELSTKDRDGYRNTLQTTIDFHQEPDVLNELKQPHSILSEVSSTVNFNVSQDKTLQTDLPIIVNFSANMQSTEEPNTIQPDEENSAVTTPEPVADLDEFNDNEDPNYRCPAEYGFFPDPNGNCTVYYACHDGKAEKRLCGEGKLHFNPITRLCDHPATALCELECPEVSGHYHVPGYCDMFLDCNVGQGKFIKCPAGLHFNAVTKQCDKPSKAACEVICPNYNTLVALPGRCNMYVSCESGNANFHLCPSGLHFNPVLLACDNPQRAGCDEQQCPSPNGYFPVLGQCGSYVECRDNRPRVNTCPSNLHFNFLLGTCDLPSKAGCVLECEKPNGFFPYNGLCSYYIKCVGGIPALQKCPREMEFNVATKQCDITKKDHCLPQCPTENGIFPVQNQCDLYIRCSNGQALVKRCPAKLHFNTLLKGCDMPERAKCQPVCPSESGVFPVPGKCNMFFRCDNYTANLFTCAQGLHYNARTLTCDWPASAHCEMSCPGLEGYYPVQGDCNAYVACSNGHPTLKTCPHGKHFNFESERCDVPEKARCHGVCSKENGRFPVPGHCDSYIHCEDGQHHLDSCPPGLLFNRGTATCDLPENVNCHSWLH